MDTNIEKVSGKKGVVIREDKYGIEVLTMRNGYQWSGMPMDAELIDMLEQAIVEFKRTQASPASAPEVRESVIEAIAEALGDAYDCTRVWSAWSYGTMSQDDFSLVAEDRSRLEEIADAAMLAAAPTPPVSEDKDKIIAAANALENIASTSSSTRIRRVANDALTAIRARRK